LKKYRLLYIISIFLTFVPFDLNTGMILFLSGALFSFLYIRIRKFGMPYYIAFLALFGVFMFTFFLLNVVESKNLYYSLNIIPIVILSYYLPENHKEVIKFTFIFLISIILLHNLINPYFPLIALIISLYELLKEQKNRKIVIAMYTIFIIFSALNFQTSYNPLKAFRFSPDTHLLEEKEMEKKKVTNTLIGKKLKPQKTVVEKKKDEFLSNITVEEKEKIELNNKIVDSIVLINILIGGVLGIITAYFTWRYLTKNERKKIIISIIIFFSILSLMATGIAYMKRGRLPMADKEIEQIISENGTNKFKTNNDAITASENMNIFREIATSPRTAFMKLYDKIKWVFYIISIIFGILLAMAIIKFMKKQEKENEIVEKYFIDEQGKEDIPYLIESGYKYIRKKFFKAFSHLTPYELLYKIEYPEEFELLTNLFVLKEYGERKYDYTQDEIMGMILKSIEYFKNIHKVSKY